jgi:hypothetical protein
MQEVTAASPKAPSLLVPRVLGRPVVVSGYCTAARMLLEVRSLPTPNSGDSFTIVTYGSGNGDFAPLNIPAAGTWDPKAGTVTF